MIQNRLHFFLVAFYIFSQFQDGDGFCWKPNTSPFYGAPKASRVGGGEGRRVRVDWSSVFNSGDGCDKVDFLIMTHPRDTPSAYTLSDFTLKGQRSATLQLEGDGDYVFQVGILAKHVTCMIFYYLNLQDSNRQSLFVCYHRLLPEKTKARNMELTINIAT